jgi:autotransporter-associated beta strand protein
MKPKLHSLPTTPHQPFFRMLTSHLHAGLVVMILTAGISHATDCTWNVASGTWNVSGSWTPSIPVGLGTDNVFFSSEGVGGSPVTVTLDGNRVVNSVTFQSSSTTLITAGASNRSLAMAAGLTVQSGTGAVTISTASNASNGLQISADQVWTNDGTLTITNMIRPSISTDARTLTLTGSGTTEISGAGRFRDILSLVKEGPGTLTLGGTPNNYTYTGTLTVKAGAVSDC